MNDGSCIWIVEDSASRVDLRRPLERIAATFGDSFPRVLVFAIGLDDDDADKIETLNAERIRRYPLTVPTIGGPNGTSGTQKPSSRSSARGFDRTTWFSSTERSKDAVGKRGTTGISATFSMPFAPTSPRIHA